MTQVRDTSLEAFAESQGAFVTQEMRVFDFIRANPDCTDMDISIGLCMSINAVNGRRNELFKSGLIESTKKIKSKQTGRSVYAWRSRI